MGHEYHQGSATVTEREGEHGTWEQGKLAGEWLLCVGRSTGRTEVGRDHRWPWAWPWAEGMRMQIEDSLLHRTLQSAGLRQGGPWTCPHRASGPRALWSAPRANHVGPYPVVCFSAHLPVIRHAQPQRQHPGMSQDLGSPPGSKSQLHVGIDVTSIILLFAALRSEIEDIDRRLRSEL